MPVAAHNSRLQTCKLKAETWTHVHVGCGKTLSRWEYFFDKDRLVLLDYAKLADEASRSPDLIDKMVEAANDPTGSLQTFLRTRDLLTRRRLAAAYRSLPEYLVKIDEDNRQIRNLKLFSGSPRCYVPGSSIKGALRTAYMSDRVSRSKDKQAIFAREAGDEAVSFKNFQFNVGRPFRDLRSLDNDLFQSIIVRDTKNFLEKDIGIAGINIYARQRPSFKGENRSPLSDEDEYCEVILCQSKFEIELVLRTDKLRNKPIKSAVDLLETADRFYRRVWEFEKTNQSDLKRRKSDVADFYLDEGTKPPEDCYLLRMGHGTGQHGTSLLIDYKEHYTAEHGNAADAPLRHPSIYRKNPRLKTRSPYPYSARAAAGGGGVSERQPLGWIVIAKDMVVEND